MNFTTKQSKMTIQLASVANCDPATSMDLDVSIFCEADLIVSWPLFVNGAAKIFDGKDFLKISEILQHAAEMSLVFFSAFKRQM